MVKIRTENLKAGLLAVEKAKLEQIEERKIFGGVWCVYPKDGWYLLTSPVYNLTFIFFTRDITEVIHPSLIELACKEKLRELGSPNEWDSTRCGEWNLWLYCLLENLRKNNYNEDEVLYFLSFILNGDIEKLPGRFTKIIDETPMKKKEQHDFLVANKVDKSIINKLIKESQNKPSDIKMILKELGHAIIHLPSKAGEGELAQMCLWAYRKRGFREEDNHLYEFFRSHIKNVIKNMNSGKLDEMVIDSATGEVSNYIIDNYHTSFSRGSFASYIKRCAKGFINKELDSAIPTGDIDHLFSLNRYDKEGYTVKEAALKIDLEKGSKDKSNTENWLYDQLKKGKIPGHEPEKIITEQRTLLRRPLDDSIRLNEEELQQATELFYIKELRKMGLAKLIADKRNTSRQAAREWFNRRLKKGAKIKEILEEAGINSCDFNNQ